MNAARSFSLAVYGAAGCGRGVMPLARDQYLDVASELLFVDDDPSQLGVRNGHRVVRYRDWLMESSDMRMAILAIANAGIRERIATICRDDGVSFASVIARNAVVMDEVQIGEGAVLCPFVTITSNVRIGVHFHANLYSYVEHDCIVGDYVTFAPGVKCNGNVIIEDHVYVGAGAIIKQGRPGAPLVIGRGSVIGMGAVVTKSVPPGSTVVGNPARPR